jgi:hypothetical protein
MAKSRGAGAAQRGFEYDVYRKGGKVKKYAEGGKVDSRKGRVRAFDLEGREIPWPPSKEDYSKPPAGKIEYDEGGKRIRGYDKDTDAEIEFPPSRRNMDKPPVNLRKDTGKPISASPNREYAKGGKVKKYELGGAIDPSYVDDPRYTHLIPRTTKQIPTNVQVSRPVGKFVSGAAKNTGSSDTEKMKGILDHMKLENKVKRRIKDYEEPLHTFIQRERGGRYERDYAKGGKVKKYEEGGEVDREVRRPAFAKEMLPTRPTSQQRRMARRAPPPAPPRPSDTDVMKGIAKDMTREERVRKAEMPSEIYRKGGGVKMAGGGTCRGMGAATKGGKYTIK